METLQTSMNTAFTTIQSDVMDTLGTAVPIALAVVGTFLAIKQGVKMFKSLLGKA